MLQADRILSCGLVVYVKELIARLWHICTFIRAGPTTSVTH